MVGCNRLKIKVVLAIVVCVVALGNVAGAGNDWFTFKGNYMRTSSTNQFVEPPVLKVDWWKDLKSSISSSPVIYNKDCFISTEGDGRGLLFSMSAEDGTIQWQFPDLPNNPLANYEENGEKPWPNGAIDFPKAKLTLPITADGNRLYVPWGQNLLVLIPDSGRLVHRYNLAPHSATITTSPVVSEYYQIVVVGASNGWLYGFDLKNRDPYIRWRMPESGTDFIKSTPAFVGTCLYFGSTSKVFYCVDLKKPPYDKSKGVQPTEKPVTKWSTKLDSAINTTPAVSAGRVIVTTEAGWIYALNDKTGDIFWKYNVGDKRIDSSPAVGKGHVVVAAEKTLYSISESTGQYEWSTSSKKNIVSTPLIGGDYVYFTTMEGKLSIVKLKTGASVSTKNVEAPIKSSPAIANNKVFFGCDDGKFYALVTGDAEPELSVETKELIVSALPVNSTVTKTFDVQNKGGGTLDVQIASSRQWISVSPSSFELQSGDFQVVTVTISSTNQQAGTYKSLLKVNSNQGNSTIDVLVNVVRNPDKHITMTIGSKTAYISGEPITLGVAPWKSPAPAVTTMVPIRFVEDAFGCTVTWDGNTRKTTIEYDKRKVRLTFTIGINYCVLQIAKNKPQVVTMYYPATIKENKTCVPIEFMAYAFNASIDIDPSNTNKIKVIIPGD